MTHVFIHLTIYKVFYGTAKNETSCFALSHDCHDLVASHHLLSLVKTVLYDSRELPTLLSFSFTWSHFRLGKLVTMLTDFIIHSYNTLMKEDPNYAHEPYPPPTGRTSLVVQNNVSNET